MINVEEEDFLIATDIDKLIDILSTKRDIEVGKISKELKMNRKEVEKWLHVLEEEGVVNLVHRMGSLHAVWVMDQESQAPPARRAQPKTPEIEEIEIQETEEYDGGPVDLTAEIGEMASVKTPKKSLFSGIFPAKKKTKKGKKKKVPNLKLEDEEPIQGEVVDEVIEEPVYHVPEPKPKTVAPLPPMRTYEEPSRPLKKKLEKSKFLKMPVKHTGKLKDQLDEYLHLIREGKEELKSLESEKERIHREGFLSLEKEFEASLDNLEYALLEKERRILEAKERMASLPQKVDEIDEMQDALKKFDSEANTLLSKTKDGLDTGWSNLKEASDELSEELAKGEEDVMRDRSRMMQLRDMLSSIGTAESQLKETLESGRATIEDMEEKLRVVEDSMDDLVDSRAIITERIEHVQTSLERRMRSLEALRAELERIEKVEEWFKEYSDDYSEKMDELQDYVSESGDELERIKKAAEIEYVRKYLKELDAAEDQYREKMGALEMEEASIDENISDVRERIKQLMRESSELMSKYRAMSEEGLEFEEAVATAKETSKSHRAALDEKAAQRKRLLDDVKRSKRSSGKPKSKKGSKKKK